MGRWWPDPTSSSWRQTPIDGSRPFGGRAIESRARRHGPDTLRGRVRPAYSPGGRTRPGRILTIGAVGEQGLVYEGGLCDARIHITNPIQPAA